ncbi:ABC transporter permease [Candidatus Bipolaricaulota bacterium]|nr:ABC transporter permease [Candidatus Bipolaricaulota bacterium]TFH08913.1 MAG: ABC transporter permease [Candidatus Atribacteria bacterium]
MATYLARRVLQVIPTLFVISLLLFGLLSMKPGDPIDDMRRGNPGFTQADYDRLREFYGLDKPWYVQYWRWLGRAVRGDFGVSRQFGRPAASYIFNYRFPNTVLLSGLSLLVAFCVAVPAGVISALRQHTAVDYAITVGNFIGVSIPIFWLGIMLIYIFAVYFRGVLPAGGMVTPGVTGTWPMFVDRLRHLLLPVAALSSLQLAQWTRFMRSSMLETIQLDFVVTARSKGISERKVIFKHALKNAILPLITLVGLNVPLLFSGAILTETVFNWPGMGRAIFDAILVNDFNVAMVSLMFISLLVLAFNLLADVAYALIDPRIRYE